MKQLQEDDYLNHNDSYEGESYKKVSMNRF